MADTWSSWRIAEKLQAFGIPDLGRDRPDLNLDVFGGKKVERCIISYLEILELDGAAFVVFLQGVLPCQKRFIHFRVGHV